MPKLFFSSILFVLQVSLCLGQNGNMSQAEAFYEAYPDSLLTYIGGERMYTDYPLFNNVTGRIQAFSTTIPIKDNRIVEKSLDYYKTQFSDSVMINNVVLKKPLDLIASRFDNYAHFQSITFERSALFNWVNFKQSAFFSRTDFQRDARFLRSRFEGKTDFIQGKYQRRAFFYGAEFMASTSFPNSRFYGLADFSYCRFYEEVRFGHSWFFSEAKFNNIRFDTGADFSHVQFDSIASFSGCKIKGDLNFNGAKLPSYLDLSHILEVDGKILLKSAKTNHIYGETLINLVNSDVSRFDFNYEDFQLYFPPEVSIEQRNKLYQELLNNFKVNGLVESYKKLDIEYSHFKYEAKKKNAASYIQKVWWNYGYDKGKIFVWILRVLIFFTLINTFFISTLVKSVNQLPFLSVETVEKHNLHHSIIAYFLNLPGTLVYTFVIILSGATGLGIIKDYTKIPNFIWMIYMLVVSMIGLSFSIFIFNYVLNK